MGVFVFPPFVLPPTALPIARLAVRPEDGDTAVTRGGPCAMLNSPR